MAKVDTERRDMVYVVRINRPEVRNAVDAETAGLLENAVNEFNKDRKLRVMVLTGAGDVSLLCRRRFKGGHGSYRQAECQ